MGMRIMSEQEWAKVQEKIDRFHASEFRGVNHRGEVEVLPKCAVTRLCFVRKGELCGEDEYDTVYYGCRYANAEKCIEQWTDNLFYARYVLSEGEDWVTVLREWAHVKA